MKLLDVVELTCDVPEEGLKAGDQGAIVMVYDGGKAFDVEVVDKQGRTQAVTTLTPAQLRLTISWKPQHKSGHPQAKTAVVATKSRLRTSSKRLGNSKAIAKAS